MKGRALRRALASTDAVRVAGNVPLITDTTEWVTPDMAHAMLKRNQHNRPINWNKVEEYAAIMARGEWELHSQGIVLDPDGNILTGQKRLWALIYSGATGVHMRISRGNPARVARLLDRGTPQSARDLASRGTGRKHSPTEASIARACCALAGITRPSTDALAATLEANQDLAAALLKETAGIKKTRGVLMVMAAICAVRPAATSARQVAGHAEELASELDAALAPHDAGRCWGKGAAFGLAMEHARRIVAMNLEAR